jgi:hypothetical protein
LLSGCILFSCAASNPSEALAVGLATGLSRESVRAAKQKPAVTAKDLRGFKYFQLLHPLRERLHA